MQKIEEEERAKKEKKKKRGIEEYGGDMDEDPFPMVAKKFNIRGIENQI